MPKIFDTDSYGAVLEYAALQDRYPGQSRVEPKRVWDQANLSGGGNEFMDAWGGPDGTLTKNHLVNVLSVGRDPGTVRQKVDQAFRTLEAHGLIQPYGRDANTNTTYRVITALGRELYEDDSLDEFLFGFLRVVQKWRSSVFKLVGKNNEGIGTGFLVTPTRIATARHVVEDLAGLSVMSENGERRKHSQVLYHDDMKVDLAVVTLSQPAPEKPFRLAMGHDLLEPVVVFGYPPIPRADNAYLVVNRGEISALPVQYPDQQPIMIVSALLRGGNSGGPVVNRLAAVVGVVSRQLFKEVTEDERTVNESLGFAAATPASRLAELLR